jgi:hypothetical protein
MRVPLIIQHKNLTPNRVVACSSQMSLKTNLGSLKLIMVSNQLHIM